MSSRKTLSRQALAIEIARTGKEMAPCHHCRNAKVSPGDPPPKCILGLRSGKCSECVRKGYTDCDVTLSAPEWTRFRDTRDKLQKELEEMEEKEVELLLEESRVRERLIKHKAKKIRLRKQLRLASGRAESSVAKELEELEGEESKEDVPVVETVPSEKAFDPWQMTPLEWEQLCDPDFAWTVPPLSFVSSSFVFCFLSY